ncbi:MAG: hypothetical protein MK085_11795 [Phycisphaerales bacterium]|nr:hypothetical protein [Phycisphaerales bacterium]
MIRSLACMVSVLLASIGLADPPPIHSMSDISHEFSFYMDGRFHRQYIGELGRDARNWGNLSRAELDNINLLILVGGNPRVPYAPETVQTIEAFAGDGGTVLLMADQGRDELPGQEIAKVFGAKFSSTRATKPARGSGKLRAEEITFRGGGTLELDDTWTPLVVDKKNKPILARRDFGKGHVLLGSRGLFGRKPDASDPINAEWVTPLLVELTSAKKIDPRRAPRRNWVEHTRELGPLTLEYHDGTEQYVDQIAAEYVAVRPHLVEITGVEPAPGMLKRLLILPTGGGGFSSGVLIAIGAWWGNYPEQRYPMVELVAHEAGHSWVLPYAEPLWNEPIATYLGIQVGKRMGMDRAEETLQRQIAKGRRTDPEYTGIDPLGPKASRDLIWGKSYFVFEELEKRHGPGALAKYFRTKRKVLEPGREGYSMDDCVAVWSLAVGEDLFPWFQSLAFDVERERTDLPAPN